MATVNKDFKIKQGLIVEGTTATVNNYDVLTKKPDDQTYIIGLIGGSATPDATADTVVLRDENADFSANAITVNTLNIGEAGSITDDAGDLLIDVTLNGDDVEISANDIRLNSDDDVSLNATGSVSITGNNDITLQSENVYVGTNLAFIDSERVATRGYVDDVSSDVTDHINATEAHGATGAVVGTTNEQTLTNKTISYTDNTLTVQVANVSDLTASAAELNTLDGITASTAELNLLDGVTATTAELNHVSGVTSGIQGQLDDKAPLASPDLTGVPTAPTATAGTNNTQIATTAYADAAVAALVGSAPALLDTLQELASAMDNDPETINNLQSLAAGKQDNLTAGANIDITGATISVTGLDSADISDFSTAAVTANTGLWDTTGAAATAEQNAKDYADDLINDASSSSAEVWSAYKTSTEIGLAQQAAIDHADALTTDDVAEGSNLYFTDALAKTSAADLLTGATLTNITITGNGSGLTITAEDGIAGKTTSDLGEGTNLYFTDQRAVDALEAVVPNFTAIEIDEIAKHVATEASITTASTNNAVVWAQADYKTAEFLVNINDGTDTQVSKVILTISAGDNVAITEYAIVGTASGSLGSASATVTGSTVALTVTTVNNNSDVRVVGTLLK